MLNKLLKEIVISVVGKQAEEIVEVLSSVKYVNEFLLAKKMGITINQTRNILYQLSGLGLVSSVRKKDKKKGWYTYSWKFEVLKCLEFLKNLVFSHKNKIEEEIRAKNSKVFYACTQCGLEFDEEQALLMDFTCDECGEIFTIKDNIKQVRDLEKSLKKIDEKLKIVDDELEKEQSKLGKKRKLEIKKEEKEKARRKLQRKL